MENTKRIINFRKLAEVVRNNRLKPTQKILFVNILLYAGVSGDAFPSQQQLADDLGQTPRNIRYCLDMLYAAGLIRKKRRGFTKSNLYPINEEIYFHKDNSDRNTSSSHLGNNLPHKSGNNLPPNVTQLNNSSNDYSEEDRMRARKRIQEIRETIIPKLKGGSRR